ncbi:MAG: hypothetical protein M3542_06600, partial [Acidobacteriota bacterium]|nr:hypothetical protein [Acidobacteriota bacterium]
MKHARASLLLFLVAAAAAAQAPRVAPTPADAPTYTESVGAEYVLLPVVVLDKKGRFVDGLQQKDFRVRV